jgi:hypothetical protein
MQGRGRPNFQINQNPNNNNNNELNGLNNNDPNLKRNRSGQTPQTSNINNNNSNVLLPPIIENGNINYNQNNQRVLQSREKERMDIQGYNPDNNFRSGNPTDVVFAEINNLKKLVRKLIEGQSETQLKLNDYTKIIADQEGIFRINNLKLNEHDTKITEILMTFNNYLSLNDESTKIINDLTHNYDAVAKRAEVVDIRNKFMNFDKIIESRFLDIGGKYEDLYAKYQEISK